ncbi:MAG: class I SAM-dependent methyltransferase, partial [Actinobacteria bacterium]|nr:class I SAM-dependent methyltransferase [Actinomycetota bacterium]
MAPGRLSRIRGSLTEAYADGGFLGVSTMVAGYLRWRTGLALGDRQAAADSRKHRENARLLASMEGTPWMGMVRAAQDRITASDPDEYWGVYRSQEIGYWTEVARWLFERATAGTWRRSLDVGCGYGTLAVLLSLLSDGEVYCTDMLERRFTDELSGSSGLHFARSNIELEPLPWPGPFDVIVFTEVLEHLNFYPVPTLVKLR